MVTEPASRSLRIALVSLYALENNGIRYVATTLRRAGFSVTEIYFKDWSNNRFPWPQEQEIDALMRCLVERRVDVVGLSVRASAFHRIATTLTRRIHVQLGLPVVWGGMHPTFLPDQSIEQADHIALGEVEASVVEFFERWDRGRHPERTRGFWTRQDGGVIRNELAPPPADLDALPFRDFGSHDDKLHIDGGRITKGDPYILNPEYTLLASRGCPYWTCSYCSNTVTKPLYHGLAQDWRIRSVENIVQELELARGLNPDIKVVRFDDELFPMRKAWLEELARQWPARVGLPFEVLVDPRMVREDRLRLMQAAGLRALCMGIQAAERVNHELYHRDTTDEQIRQAQGLFAKLGIRSSLQIIWDDPASTDDDKDALFHLLMGLDQPFEIFLFGLTIYPRTHLARRLLREGRIGPQHVEGEGMHAFEQFRVDLDYPRPPSDLRWLALLVLVNKPFVTRGLLWRLYEESRFVEDPRPLVMLAKAANLANFARVGMGLMRQGELSPLMLRRWLNLDSMVTM
jgi:radical SAM superfamily enzyme YgiQ (UPF0313 family)